MSAPDLLNHLLNLAAPALFVALALVLGARVLLGKPPGTQALWAQAAINFVAGVGVLVAGLALFGRDGKMATYAALAVVCGVVQWALLRGWRR